MPTGNEPVRLGMSDFSRDYVRAYIHILHEGMDKHDYQMQQYSTYSAIMFTISYS
jgi:hypothetical protein